MEDYLVNRLSSLNKVYLSIYLSIYLSVDNFDKLFVKWIIKRN